MTGCRVETKDKIWLRARDGRLCGSWESLCTLPCLYPAESVVQFTVELVGSSACAPSFSDISCKEEGHNFQSWRITLHCDTLSLQACECPSGVKSLSQGEPELALGSLFPFVLQVNTVWSASLGLLPLQKADLGLELVLRS